MTSRDFTTTFTVDQTPDQAYAAFNNVRGWWSEGLDGGTENVGDEFTYRHGDLHVSRQRVVEMIPGRKVVWQVLEGYLSFVKESDEWRGTEIVFEAAAKGSGTEVRFTHRGLVPDFECFDTCSKGWSYYVNGSLQSLMTTGTGQPDRVSEAVATTSE